MPIKVLMPALSPTMEEGTLAKWTVKPGDQVNSGDVIAEIETDKATMEVEAVEEGKVGKLLVDEGTEGVQVNAPIAILLEEGEDDSALEGYDPEADDAGASDAKSDKKDDASEKNAESKSKSDDKAEAPQKPKGKTLSYPDIPEGTKMKEITIRDALRDAMAEEMRRTTRCS
jgi:pyruvate dehydrogenase E1 component beta subunit